MVSSGPQIVSAPGERPTTRGSGELSGEPRPCPPRLQAPATTSCTSRTFVPRRWDATGQGLGERGPLHELDGGPFQSLRIVYSRANLHCDHGDLSWSYHSHLPLSQMPDPHSAQDVLTCLRIAQRVIDRTYGQDRSKLDRTVTNNNIIADILAYGLSAGNHHGVHMNIAFNNTSNKIHVQPRIDDDPVFEASAAPWMDRLMPCLFVDSEDRKTKFGRGFLYRSIPLNPMIAMRSIAIATEAFPDLQFPTRAKTT